MRSRFRNALQGSPPRMRGKLHPRFPDICKGRITPADAGKTKRRNEHIGAHRDHPRGCGENQPHQPVGGFCPGSPPRMRGKLPAWCRRNRASRDHPRGCGENSDSADAVFRMPGSPPRMRGKPITEAFKADIDRITPADAGKTTVAQQVMHQLWDHPRGCGENAAVAVEKSDAAGSPPRMRGKLYGVCFGSDGLRITPADAGKTTDVVAFVNVLEDHPRGCGENVHRAAPLHRRLRITPADAGKTIPHSIQCSNVQDHPRGCGENCTTFPTAEQAHGSPPRMRGKRRPRRNAEDGNGITPADAGKTRQKPVRAQTPEDHPRGCGENGRSASERVRHSGSPPRMRGKLMCACMCGKGDRITPADAGKTDWRY